MNVSPKAQQRARAAYSSLIAVVDDLTIAAAESRGVARGVFTAVGHVVSHMASLVSLELERNEAPLSPPLNHAPATPADEPEPQYAAVNAQLCAAPKCDRVAVSGMALCLRCIGVEASGAEVRHG